jgi:hypothetical protein
MRPFTAVVSLFLGGLLVAGVAVVSRGHRVHARPPVTAADDAAEPAPSPVAAAPPRFVSAESTLDQMEEGGAAIPRFASNDPPPDSPEPPPLTAADREAAGRARTRELAERLALDPQREAALAQVLSSAWQRSDDLRRRIIGGDPSGTAALVAARRDADRELERVLGREGARRLRALERQGDEPSLRRRPPLRHATAVPAAPAAPVEQGSTATRLDPESQ